MADDLSATFSSVRLARSGADLVRRIRVVHAPAAPPWPDVVLGAEPVVIGRAGSATGPLALDDREVSRLHAVIEVDGDRHRLVDRGSHNGTFVDGQRVEVAAPLIPGTVIRIGKTLMVYLEHGAAEPSSAAPETPRLLGRSEPIRRLRAEIAMVAPRPIPVLVVGETGAGKELVAEEIHRQSGRTGPFVAINCAALPEQLAESELFGHVAGAFTGASRRADGVFLGANGGTLLLDEVGECPPSVQAKLLRALGRGEIRPVGAAEPIVVDVRIVAATNRDLRAELARDAFRADLFSRLSGWVQQVVPLRERRDDVLFLARVFLGRTAPGLSLSTNAAEALLVYGWPYNVRELEQACATAGVRAAAGGGRVRCEHLPPVVTAVLGERAGEREPAPEVDEVSLDVARDAAPDRDGLLAVVAYYGGNIAQVAEYFGKDRKQIYRWAERLDIDLASLRRT